MELPENQFNGAILKRKGRAIRSALILVR